MRVLVAGATGNLGKALCNHLRIQGHEVVGLARNREKLEKVTGLAQRRVADVTDPRTLEHACDGVDVVVSTVGLVGVKALGSRLGHDEVDFQGNLNLLREAERAGVRKFVYVSVQHAGLSDDVPLLQAKGKMEEALRVSGLDWLIVRPTVYFEQIRQGLFEPARRGVAFVVGKGTTKVSPVAAEDVARWIATHLDEKERVVELGGPEALSYEQIARMSFEALGRKPRVVHVPPRLLGTAAIVSKPLPLATSSELSYLKFALTHDHVAPPVGEHRLGEDLALHKQ